MLPAHDSPESDAIYPHIGAREKHQLEHVIEGEENMATANDSVLLILDDEPMIVRLITRWFKKDFAEILYASTPDEAEDFLNTRPVTHFVCDSNLGPNQPRGIELINQWYPMYPSIRKAVLFTGLAIDAVPADRGIDVISKGDDPTVLLDYLKNSLKQPEAQA